MQQQYPQPRRRCEGIHQPCPTTVRLPSSPALLTCLLSLFENFAWLGEYHRHLVLNQDMMSCARVDSPSSCITYRPSNMCSRRRRRNMHAHLHALGQGIVSGALHTYVHTRTHISDHVTATAPTQVCLERPSRGAHVFVLLQVSTLGLGPWSYDIQPRIATVMKKTQTLSVRHPRLHLAP